MNDFVKIVLLFSLVLLLMIISSVVIGLMYSIPAGNIAQININGEIVASNDLFTTGVTSDEIIGLIQSAEENPNVEAIVLSINSPGGTVVASKEIAEYISSSNMTFVAWIRELGASGAYLIASACDYIVVDGLSITGSIGATSSYLDFSETLEQYGVEYTRLVSGEHKDIGSPYRNLSEDEEEILMNLVDESFEYFLNFIVENRDLSNSTVELISDGRILSGSQAFELGLADELGSREEVINYLEFLNITDIVFEEYTSVDLFSDLTNFFSFKAITAILPTYN